MSAYGGDIERPAGELISFVGTLYDDVDWVVAMRLPLFGADVESAEGPLGDLAEFLSWLADAWPGVLDTRQDVLERIATLPEDLLSAYGLVGLELRVKLLAWQRARRRLRLAVVEEGVFEERPELSEESPLPSAQRSLPRPRRFRRVKRVLRWTSRLLGHADTVLGSLTALVGQAERLKEIKETVEKVSGEVADDIAE